MAHESASRAASGNEIAVIGMASRLPGARDVAQLWKNLRDGVESVRFFTEEELLAAGESPDLLLDPAYVKACPTLEGVDQFDAGFFGFSPRDAAVMDPQHRFFLEVAWAAMEDAGYNVETHGNGVGVFGASGMNLYMMYNLISNPDLMKSLGDFMVRHAGNDKDFLATRVSYEMNLNGPSINVQTACSSSLVAIHLAVQSLLTGECDMAMAGGVTILLPQIRGYVFSEGEIMSPDGHCRAFDAESKGTIFGSGVGIVVLKRLDDALADGDNVLAVIKGTAINNDGAMKVGYLAPSVEGQAKAITEAITLSGVDPATIDYVECHGTGTMVGDPIEISAITQAYRNFTDKTGFCAIGSLKSNIGHLGETSGVAGFIKTVLSLKNGMIPASLNYSAPNPQIDFANSPFFVNTKLTPWVRSGRPRRAGVTALGAGGTNAHVILEQAPEPAASSPGRTWQLLLLSARSSAALDAATLNLANHLREHPTDNLADVAYTLAVGRKGFEQRRVVVCSGREDALTTLGGADAKRMVTQALPKGNASVVFMFPGGGAQYATMGRDLYETEPVYAQAIDECLNYIKPQLGIDLRTLMFPPPGQAEAATKELEKPSLALPTLFATEYALAKLLMSWGVSPAAMIGHSMGEYVVACLAGVFSYQDGMALVTLRGRLFEKLPEGGMLSVPLPEAEARKFMGPELSFAAINGPSLSVVSGPVGAIAAVERALVEREIECTRIHINVAAHSSMLEPILGEFERFCSSIRFKPPVQPYISNLTGTWITAAQATDPAYWVKHLRHTVRFADGMAELLKEPGRLLLEIGPGRTLSSLSKQQFGKLVSASLSTLRHPKEEGSDVAFLLTTYGRLWMSGLKLDWSRFYGEQNRRRVSLPTYPFEHERFWVEPGQSVSSQQKKHLRKRPAIADWFYLPSWKPAINAGVSDGMAASASWLVFLDETGLGQRFVERLKGARVVTVSIGKRFAKKDEGRFYINPVERADYDSLLAELQSSGGLPEQVVHFWSVTAMDRQADPLAKLDSALNLNFYSLFYLAQALAAEEDPLRLTVVSNGGQQIAGESSLAPEKSLVLGPVRVIPHEFPHISARVVDVGWTPASAGQSEAVTRHILSECFSTTHESLVAWRGPDRWVQSTDPVRIDTAAPIEARLREGGVYLITGGLGGIGFELAKHLVQSCRAKVALLGRSALPAREAYAGWLSEHNDQDATSKAIRKIQLLESLGGEVLPLTADVTDVDQMKRAVALTLKRFGSLQGVVHAAGILQDSLIQLKTRAEADRVILPKVKGALVLQAALQGTNLDFLALCSSVSSFLGLPGQVDYTAANAFLDAFARKRTWQDGLRTISINWSAWQQVGMASAIAGHPQSLAREPEPIAFQKSQYPFWDSFHETPHRDVVFKTMFSREKHWLLSEHVVKGGDALIPGTGFIELVRAAWAQVSKSDGVELSDVLFLAPFPVKSSTPRELRLTFHRKESGADFKLESVPSMELHSTGKVRSLPAEPLPTHAISILRGRCRRRTEVLDGFLNQTFMDFGPRWANLRRIDYGESEALVSLEIPESFASELDVFRCHPALLDMATGGAQSLIPGFDKEKDFYIPFSYGRFRMYRPLPAKLLSHVRYHSGGGHDVAIFDVTLLDESGNEIASVADFMMARFKKDRPLTAQPVGDPGPAPASAPTQLLNAVLREGILPSEGMEAFDRVLSQPSLSQIVTSSVDLHLWQEQVDRLSRPEEEPKAGDPVGGLKLPKTNMQKEFSAPRNKEEKFLAQVWQELLGVEKVGIHDDFFELGGQSLIAVRLFNRIKKHYKLEFGLAVLFEAPTIEKCAAMIRERLGLPALDVEDAAAENGAPVKLDTAAPVVPPKASSCIVPMKPGGTRPPLFVIHGMGGNILEYTHIAKHLHPDQPMYGIQAQGLDGKKPIQSRIEEIASTYIEEIRVFQPVGPYYIAGSSFGGLVGYEMAQQLLRKGERVALLFLFDSYGKDYPKLLPARLAFYHALKYEQYRWHLHLSNLRLLSRAEMMPYVKEKAKTARRRVGKMFKRLLNTTQRKFHLLMLPKPLREQAIMTGEDPRMMRGIAVPKAFQEVQNAAIQACDLYKFQPYGGKVVLFRALYQRPAIYEDRTNGWGELVKDLEIHVIPGHHGAIIREPRVGKLVQILSSCLEKTQVAERSRPSLLSDKAALPQDDHSQAGQS
jgi:acyl transferase domain-containing protein/thioesterase domain-containing protein